MLVLWLICITAWTAPERAMQAGHLKPAAGHYLVARRHLGDRWFGRSVVLIAEHGESGTLGFIVNRRTEVRLEDAIDGLPAELGDIRLYLGGPVGLRRLVMLSTRTIRDGMQIGPGIYFSADRNLLEEQLAKAPDAVRIIVGHAAWAPGQLAAEIARGDWYVSGAEPQQIFEAPPDLIWSRLIDSVDRPANLAGLGQRGAINSPPASG